jgi:hypothetical protein
LAFNGAAAAREKELALLTKLELKGQAVSPGILDPLMAVLIQADTVALLPAFFHVLYRSACLWYSG